MTTKLKLYNKAAGHLSTVRLASTTEAHKTRYELDAVYDDTLQACLEKGLWKFGKRTVHLEYDTAITPDFGPAYAFAQPDDYVRTFAFCTDEMLENEVEDYLEENGVWYAPVTDIYLAYLSNDASYGLNLGLWTENFAEYVGAQLALNCALPITRDKFTRNDLLTLSSNYLKVAKRLDAVDEPIKRKPMGRLVQSRLGGYSGPNFRNGKMSWNR